MSAANRNAPYRGDRHGDGVMADGWNQITANWNEMSAEERIETIRPLAREGMSASEIAARIEGANRNKIIGYCSRHNIQLGSMGNGLAKPRAQSVRKVKRKPRRIVNTLGTWKQGVTERLEPAPMPVPEDDNTGVPYLEAGAMSGQCCAPLWDEWPGTENARYCGKPVTEDSVWCEAHRERFCPQYWTAGDEAAE